MDAKIHNESERYLLKAISELQKYVGCDISVRVEAKNEGDIIDNLLLICDKIDISGILTALLAGFVGLFFPIFWVFLSNLTVKFVLPSGNEI